MYKPQRKRGSKISFKKALKPTNSDKFDVANLIKYKVYVLYTTTHGILMASSKLENNVINQ